MRHTPGKIITLYSVIIGFGYILLDQTFGQNGTANVPYILVACMGGMFVGLHLKKKSRTHPS